MRARLFAIAAAGLIAGATAPAAPALADMTDLAKKASNPIAAMISLPMQYNYDTGFGPEDGHRHQLNIQPVVPFEMDNGWNLISRTIVPVIGQHDVAGRSGRQSGLGDITQSLFLSPATNEPGALIWGVGPVFVLPTATDDMLGARKWGAGVTGVALRQNGPWTYGGLANHIWSVGGPGDGPDFSVTFLQPFLSYTTAQVWTFGLNTESTYDWKAEEWTVPINLSVGKLTEIGGQPVSFTAGMRYWADSPEQGPEGWAFRFTASLLFPK